MPKFFSPTSYKLKAKSFFLSPRQKGQSTIYLVIILMVVIFAVMFVGGGESLLSGGTATSVTNTPSPSQDQTSPTTAPTASPSATPAQTWSITFTLDPGCKTTGSIVSKKGTAIAKGVAIGYVALEIEDGTSFRQFESQEFRGPELHYPLDLKGKNGFGTLKWKLVLYSGGTQDSNGQWSGGTKQTETDGTPTTCT